MGGWGLGGGGWWAVGEGVLERVFEVGKEIRLVQELGGLEVHEAGSNGLLSVLGDGLQEREGNLASDDRGRLEQALVLRRETIDPRGQDGLGRGRDLKRRGSPGEAICRAVTGQHARFHERPYTLFQEERIALRPLDEQALERAQAGVLTQQGAEQRLGALRGQRIDADL